MDWSCVEWRWQGRQCAVLWMVEGARTIWAGRQGRKRVGQLPDCQWTANEREGDQPATGTGMRDKENEHCGWKPSTVDERSAMSGHAAPVLG